MKMPYSYSRIKDDTREQFIRAMMFLNNRRTEYLENPQELLRSLKRNEDNGNESKQSKRCQDIEAILKDCSFGCQTENVRRLFSAYIEEEIPIQHTSGKDNPLELINSNWGNGHDTMRAGMVFKFHSDITRFNRVGVALNNSMTNSMPGTIQTSHDYTGLSRGDINYVTVPTNEEIRVAFTDGEVRLYDNLHFILPFYFLYSDVIDAELGLGAISE